MNPVSVEAFDIFSQEEISNCDSCGVNSDCESETWSSARVSNDICVLPYFAVEVVGDGEPSDSGWEFGSEDGSVAGWEFGSPETTPPVVTVMCEDGILWNRSPFLSPGTVISLVWKKRRT